MVALNKPAAGNTDWTVAVNDNWTTIEESIDQAMFQGRLTLSSGVPITTSDVLSATTLYFTPYKGNRISLYDGTTWVIHTFSELSLSLSGLTADTNYDIFLYDNSGVLTLEHTAWTNDTTRATSLVLQDGIYVRSGALTRRWLGTIRTTSTTGQCEDSDTKRFVINYYNAVARKLLVVESTGSWTYSSTTWRPMNNSTANRVEFISTGENPYWLMGKLNSSNNTGFGGASDVAQGVGIDSTTTNSADLGGWMYNSDGDFLMGVCSSNGTLGAGYHFLQMLESGGSNGTTTFYGTRGTTLFSGGVGWVMG